MPGKKIRQSSYEVTIKPLAKSGISFPKHCALRCRILLSDVILVVKAIKVEEVKLRRPSQINTHDSVSHRRK